MAKCTFTYLVAILSCFSSTFCLPVAENNFNYKYVKSGELLNTESSNQYPQYDNIGSSNLRGYDFGNSGGYSGNNFQNQAFGGSNFGFSGSGAGFGFGNGFGNGAGYINNPGFQSGSQLGYVQRPFVSGGFQGIHGGHLGGGYVDRNQYESAKKNVGDENLERINAQAGSSANQNNQGYNQGAVQQSNAKADSGYYKDEVANKNQVGDGKVYQAATNFDKTGKNGEAENAQKSHKKGHVTKGFKSSHRKDEEEKTETFYDEAHDEADRKNFGQNQGSFGEKSEASVKTGHENESLDAKTQAKQGHYNTQNKYDDSKANKGEYGQSGYKGNSEQLHKLNNLGAQTVLGHQESSGEFNSKKPYGILPINA